MSERVLNANHRHPALADLLWRVDADRRLAVLRALVLAFAGTALLTLSAKVQVPFWPVPMTMQTMVVLMIGAAYGWKLGTATVLLYLVEGALGLPVFAGTPEKGLGLAYMAGPTGGYLVGFLVAAGVTGFLVERGFGRGFWRLFAVMALGHAIILGLGFGWLATLIGTTKAWFGGVAPFYAATLFKNALGAALIAQTAILAARRS
jgi:biotin transport system substrate-specific component